MISEEMRHTLLDILRHTERLDKIQVSADPVSRTVTIVYEDLDDSWFGEVVAAGANTSKVVQP